MPAGGSQDVKVEPARKTRLPLTTVDKYIHTTLSAGDNNDGQCFLTRNVTTNSSELAHVGNIEDGGNMPKKEDNK